ncbi:dTMP kinase [Actinacidiphila alni]|uniref:dTMP kinase n=1 Tax=Actinacidiphila alni TaxID=380248 RepID=UPI003451BBC1
MHLVPGTLVVLEGLDRSGKSTQSAALAGLPWAEPAPLFMHLPSGRSRFTAGVYRLTEQEPIASPLARQLLHLACHAENIGAVSEARDRGGVVLDRWWWSTVAYGWYGARLAEQGLDKDAFFSMIDLVWSGQPADVVFLFTTPYERDALNREPVREGYRRIATDHSTITVEVPSADAAATTDFLLAALRERDFLTLA